MAFINEHEDIFTVVAVFLLHSGFKLVNQGRYNSISTFFQQFNQSLAGLGTVRTHLCMNEVIPDLFIQVDAVSYHHKAGPLDVARLHALPDNHLGQHDHSDSFTTALCVPNNTVTSVFAVLQQNSLHALFNCKILLVATDFLYIVIVDDKIANQIQQPIRVQQGNQGTILLLDLTIRRTLATPVVQPFFVILMPGYKVLCRSTASTVQNLVRIHG